MTLATITQSNSYTEVFMSAEENKGKITPLMYFLICCAVQTLLISSLQKKKSNLKKICMVHNHCNITDSSSSLQWQPPKLVIQTTLG